MLLGFDVPLHNNGAGGHYTIPDAYDTQKIAREGIYDVCGRNKTWYDPFRDFMVWGVMKNPEKIPKRVRPALEMLLDKGYPDHGEFGYSLFEYLVNNSHPFSPRRHFLEGEWIYMWGELYQWRRGEWEKAEKQAKEHWGGDWAFFEQVHSAMRPRLIEWKKEHERR